MLIPNWSVPSPIHAVCFDKHDSDADIEQMLPHSPILLNQVHGQAVVAEPFNAGTEADGCYTRTAKSLCAIKTADCLAIYLASRQQAEIALLHGGWRGLSQNIIDQGLDHFQSDPAAIVAYLGPAISAPCYEVGLEVYQAFCDREPALATLAFQATRPGHYLCDLYAIARFQLRRRGIQTIYGGDHCTFTDAARFHSFRREGAQAGRLLHCLWIEEAF